MQVVERHWFLHTVRLFEQLWHCSAPFMVKHELQLAMVQLVVKQVLLLRV